MSDMYGYVHASEIAVGQIPANILDLHTVADVIEIPLRSHSLSNEASTCCKLCKTWRMKVARCMVV